MKGGKERVALDKDASLKGMMTSKEVSKLTRLLIGWVLRDSAKAEQAIEDCEVCGFFSNPSFFFLLTPASRWLQNFA
jgi:hypothetical protein